MARNTYRHQWFHSVDRTATGLGNEKSPSWNMTAVWPICILHDATLVHRGDYLRMGAYTEAFSAFFGAQSVSWLYSSAGEPGDA
jgi:hypothetical protein